MNGYGLIHGKMREFSFYLYTRIGNKRFSFASLDDNVVERIAGMINALPIVEGGNVMALLQNTLELRDIIAVFEAEIKKELPQIQQILPFVRRLEENDYFYYLDGKAPLINHF